MNYTKKGIIESIGEVQELKDGAKSLRYRVNTGEQYNNIWEFEIYKGSEYASHVDKFIEFNKVGDEVEVEFNIRPRVWEGKVFTSLSHWKINKAGRKEEAVEAVNNAHANSDPDDDLPF